MEACVSELDINVVSSDIESAHRLGQHKEGNTGPIIVNFLSYKVKQSVLERGYKLRKSGMSVGEDFSTTIQYEHRQLLNFAKTQDSRFKLRFNKLTIENKSYKRTLPLAIKILLRKKGYQCIIICRSYKQQKHKKQSR